MSYLTYRYFRPLKCQIIRFQEKRMIASGNKFVEVSSSGDSGISIVTLNRPPVNSLNLELLKQIGDTIDELEKKKCIGMILESSLPTVFSAGLDLNEVYKPDPVRLKTFWTALQDMWLKLYGSSFPTVSAICGHAPAGGCLISLSCDYRIMVASPRYKIGLNETKVGIVVPKFVEQSMLNVIGMRQTELALTSGKLFSVDEALQVGLIDEIAADKTDAMNKAKAYLARLTKLEPNAVGITKRHGREKVLNWLIENKEKDLEFYMKWFQKSEVQETVQTILEKLQSRK